MTDNMRTNNPFFLVIINVYCAHTNTRITLTTVMTISTAGCRLNVLLINVCVPNRRYSLFQTIRYRYGTHSTVSYLTVAIR
jgi:hypothetical protein